MIYAADGIHTNFFSGRLTLKGYLSTMLQAQLNVVMKRSLTLWKVRRAHMLRLFGVTLTIGHVSRIAAVYRG